VLKENNPPQFYIHSKYLPRMKVKIKILSAKNRIRPQTYTRKKQNVFRKKENNPKWKVQRARRNKKQPICG